MTRPPFPPRWCWILLVAFLPAVAVAAPREVRGVLRCTGSETMDLLLARLAEAFARRHPGVRLEIEGKGSGTALRALEWGGARLAAMSRPPSGEERRRWRELGLSVREVEVGRDTVRLWRRVGSGSDAPALAFRPGYRGPLHPVGRTLSSGTRQEALLLLAGHPAGTVAMTSPLYLLQTLADDPRAVGYAGSNFRLSGLEPADEAFQVRPLLLLAREGDALARLFQDYARGVEGQEIVRLSGFAPAQGGPP